MRGERPVDQAGWHVKPCDTIGFHDERLAAGMSIKADSTGLRLRLRWFGGGEIGDVVPGPFLAVPPNPFLALAPRFARGIRGGAVVHQPAIGGPGVTPIELRPRLSGRIRLLAGGAIFVRRGKDAAVDPGGAGGGTV